MDADGRRLIRVACLHTAASNAAVFDAVAAAIPGLSLHHAVRADLLAAAEAGGLTPALAAATAGAMASLSGQADAVLLTCSTLGPAAAMAPAGCAPWLRVDEALAREAVAAGGSVVVLCALSATLAATDALFAAAAAGTGSVVDLRLVPGAWAAFRSGDHAAYHALVAAAADAAAGPGIVVALAQASMAPAAGLCRTAVLTSPGVGLAAAVRLARDNGPRP